MECTIFLLELVQHHNEPALLVVMQNGENYTLPLTNSLQVYCCNMFLRSLFPRMIIEFKTYKQYEELIKQCDDLLPDITYKPKLVAQRVENQ